MFFFEPKINLLPTTKKHLKGFDKFQEHKTREISFNLSDF